MSSDNITIRVRGLGKKYVLGGPQEKYLTFRDAIVNSFKTPFKRFSPAAAPPAEGFWALNKVSFDVNKGEVVGIIGRNGAGKSTLLKILSRITAPTVGTVELYGRVGSLLEVGTGFHQEMTGRENIFLNGSILGMKKTEIEQKFDEIIKFAEIEKFLDTPVKRYSSGMYIRLAFAVAAHLEPEILIVDEVLAVGDVQFQKKCLKKMEDVANIGRTVLFVSHNLTAIRQLCTRVILLDKGHLIADGNPEDVIDQYIGRRLEFQYTREWQNELEAPQNESFLIKKISINDEKGNVLNQISTETPFNVEITYLVKKPESYFGVSLSFWDQKDSCILVSMNNHEKNYYGKSMPLGIYKSICKIPANYFNDKQYNLGVYFFGKCYSDGHQITDALKIEILDSSSNRGDYFGGYLGVVRPFFEWKTIKDE
jgi:lipopolysaccharide transport system ATP-binding protein